MIQHVVVEADDLVAARQKVLNEEGDLNDWDGSWEGDARDTMITHAKLVPAGYDLDAPTTDDPDGRRWEPLAPISLQRRHRPAAQHSRGTRQRFME